MLCKSRVIGHHMTGLGTAGRSRRNLVQDYGRSKQANDPSIPPRRGCHAYRLCPIDAALISCLRRHQPADRPGRLAIGRQRRGLPGSGRHRCARREFAARRAGCAGAASGRGAAATAPGEAPGGRRSHRPSPSSRWRASTRCPDSPGSLRPAESLVPQGRRVRAEGFDEGLILGHARVDLLAVVEE